MPTLRLCPANTEDYRWLAERRLPRRIFDYIDGGAYDERTLGANVERFQAMELKQRVMRDVSTLSTKAEILDAPATMPLALSPIGMAGMNRRRGEVQAKRAADAFGVPFCLSTVSICSMEEVAAVSGKPFWFQLYMLKDRAVISELLERARGLGVETLVFTVDLAVVGARYRDIRNGMSPDANVWMRLRAGLLSYMLHPDWTLDVGVLGKPHTFGNISEYVPKATTPNDFVGWVASQFDASVTWEDIEWLRREWPGKLVIKGVLCAEDAVAAVNAGADAVIVSNHGGRQLDGVAATIDILPEIVDAIDGRANVIVDGGIRSGLDIVRALAAGADTAMIGRPWIYALAARGEAGVAELLKTMQAEMNVAMALTGVTSVDQITPEIIRTGRRSKDANASDSLP